MTLVRLAKEEEGVGISAGAHLAGREVGDADAEPRLPRRRSTASSPCAQLYRIPLLMLISYRGEFGERDPWQTEGGGVTEHAAARAADSATTRSTIPTTSRADREGADAGGVGEQAGRAAAAAAT